MGYPEVRRPGFVSSVLVRGVCVRSCLALGVLCSFLSYDDLIVNQILFGKTFDTVGHGPNQ